MIMDNFSGKYPATAVLAIAALCGAWYSFVLDQVPNPYLDEVFHVRQAQVYCSGDFRTWDPKITTPPGLYCASYLLFRGFGTCDISVLRLTNVGFLCLVGLAAYYAGKTIAQSKGDRMCSPDSGMSAEDWQLAHTAVNICLFPPLFFFSALYYTDIGSLLCVVLSIHSCNWHLRKRSLGISVATLHIALGALALLFRQTNIFWVAIFPAALVALETLKSHPDGFSDKPIEAARLEEYFMMIFSLLIAIPKSIPRLVIGVLPYAMVLGGFALFVFWNGGVVLGDKSNHIATLHLPQMLYLWPYMLFFSFPVAVPTVLSSVLGGGKTWSLKISELPRLWTILVLSTLAALVVHYNTIVHPFTLADNRHYVFYVFRILTRHRYIKYLVTPIYIICGWIMIRTLGGSKATHQQAKPPKDGRTVLQDPIEPLEPSADNCHTSFVLAWLGTTALCLVTAPLVEPRYFIIPWVVWRFHVPLYTPKEANPDMGTPKKVPKSVKSDWWKTLLQPEIWLWVETLWFCLINCVTGYIFLNWTFEWPQELGQKQRFMW